MSDHPSCRFCGRQLTGAIENTIAQQGKFVFIVLRETSDRNWVKCPGCKQVACKACYRNSPKYCCNEGRIIDRERARVSVAESEAVEEV